MCWGMCCNAQLNPVGYDTILVAEEHFASDFVLYAVVPKTIADIQMKQGLNPCKVYVQVTAHIDVEEDGALPDRQRNSSKITIIAIIDNETGMNLYRNNRNNDEHDDTMTSFLDVLSCYYQNKFDNVHYYLVGQFVVPSEIVYYYVDIIQ